MHDTQQKVLGLVAEFENPAALLHAAETMRDAGYKKFECHAPFPIHGMFDAMGQRRSPLGLIIALVAFAGTCGGLLLQWWTNAVDYPLVISGKPLISYQAYAPVGFGIAILLSAGATVFFLAVLNKMPSFFHPVFYSDRIAKVTDDGFFVSVESRDQKFDATGTTELLESAGGHNVELLQPPATSSK